MELLEYISSLGLGTRLTTIIIVYLILDKTGTWDRLLDAVKTVYHDWHKKREEDLYSKDSIEAARYDFEAQQKTLDAYKDQYREDRLFKVVENWLNDRTNNILKKIEQLVVKVNQLVDEDNQQNKILGELKGDMNMLSTRIHYLSDSIRELAGIIAERVEPRDR